MTTKKCDTCKEIKHLTDFNKNKCKKDGLNSICRSCSNARSKRYYAENREKHLEVIKVRSRKLNRTNQDNMLQYLSESGGCVDCGETDIVVLEFDHLDSSNKEANISNVYKSWKWERTLSEIAKCDVVCANCHRKRTAARSNNYRHQHYLSTLVGLEGVEPSQI